MDDKIELNKKTGSKVAIDAIINVIGMIMVIYATAYFFIAITD